MINIIAVNIKDYVSENKLKTLESYLPKERISEIKKFKFKEDFLRSFYGEILLRYIANKKFLILNSDIEVDRTKYGKPYIKNLYNFHFNISHSNDWVICGYGCKNLGIDIEKIKIASLDISKNFFTKDENSYLSSKSKEQKNLYFYKLWTLKESYLKWTGEGLNISLDSFSIYEYNNKFYIKGLENKVILNQFIYDDNYVISVCSEEKCNYEVEKISINNINL